MRTRPNVVLRRRTPNRSARPAGTPILLLVLHSTESHNRPGTGDLAAVCDWLARPETEASAHVIVDAEGQSARLVADEEKAWHCGVMNGVSLGVEQIGRAAQGKAAWKDAPRELDETARWLARWSLKWDVPLRRGRVDGSRVREAGVVAHGELPGDHWDPGEYPFALVIDRAREFRRALLRRT